MKHTLAMIRMARVIQNLTRGPSIRSSSRCNELWFHYAAHPPLPQTTGSAFGRFCLFSLDCPRQPIYRPRPWACPARMDSARRRTLTWSDLGMKPVIEENVGRMDRRVFLGMGLGSLAVLAGCQ